MSELKRFIRWCIKNDLAFTHIAEAIEAFRGSEEGHVSKEELRREYWPFLEERMTADDSDGTREAGKYWVIY